MKDLRIGDSIKVKEGIYSQVFMFTHQDINTEYNFIHIVSKHECEITLTHGHYLYVNERLEMAAKCFSKESHSLLY